MTCIGPFQNESHVEGVLLLSAIFLNNIGSRMHSDQKFSRGGGGVSYIDARKENVLEQRSGSFHHKNTPASAQLTFCMSFK
jgi:hypothetical protein